jgi:hypothetical protein
MGWSDVLKAVIPIVVAALAWLLGQVLQWLRGCPVYEEGKSNLTANRIDNSVGHEIDNVVPMCCWCNCALSNR